MDWEQESARRMAYSDRVHGLAGEEQAQVGALLAELEAKGERELSRKIKNAVAVFGCALVEAAYGVPEGAGK